MAFCRTEWTVVRSGTPVAVSSAVIVIESDVAYDTNHEYLTTAGCNTMYNVQEYL